MEELIAGSPFIQFDEETPIRTRNMAHNHPAPVPITRTKFLLLNA